MTKNDELIGKLVSVADVLKLAKVALNTVHVPQWGARSASLKLVSRKCCRHMHRARADSLTFDKDALWMFPAHFLSSNVYNCIIV